MVRASTENQPAIPRMAVEIIRDHKGLQALPAGFDLRQRIASQHAMQAGRELRVIVESEKVSDQYADDLSFMISQKIQDEMQYPGQVKVTVIREKRATSFAKAFVKAFIPPFDAE